MGLQTEGDTIRGDVEQVYGGQSGTNFWGTRRQPRCSSAAPGRTARAGAEATTCSTATATVDNLNGEAGDDTIDGGEGNDHLDGGTENDQVSGGNGNDFLAGGAGNDIESGGAGHDSLGRARSRTAPTR